MLSSSPSSFCSVPLESSEAPVTNPLRVSTHVGVWRKRNKVKEIRAAKGVW